MKLLNYFGIATLAIIMVACGGKKVQDSEEERTENENEVTLKVESQLGELGEFISTINEDVVLKLEEQEYTKDWYFVKGAFTFDVPNSFKSTKEVDLNLTILDKDHVKITKLESITLPATPKNGSYVLFRGNTIGELQATYSQQNVDEDWKKIKEKGVYALLTPYYENAEYSLYSNQISKENEDSGTDSWDKLLDQYEGLVNKYISLTNKLKNGDYEALAEGYQLIDKAEELDQKFNNAEEEMSSSQWKRYMELNTKMANAMKSLME
ncbi:MAG: hypothetical protein J1F43_00245 [Muribaculaceae bacterium]|nr:hypothetical protein [Muribaculaceae bacterium]